MKKDIVKFKPRIDYSTWLIVGFVVICCGWPIILDASPTMILILLGCMLLCLLPFVSIWYEVDGDDLVVYAFWRPSRYPISQIKRIDRTTSILSAPATSLTGRLAIYFTDRKVLKSSMPLLISPANQQRFIATLLSINPAIVVDFSENKKESRQ